MSSSRVVALRDLTFAYDSASEPLFSNLNLNLHSGFTGLVGPNGVGKSTLLKLIVGQLQPASGEVVWPNRVAAGSNLQYCEQRTDAPPEDLNHFLADWTPVARRLKDRFQISGTTFTDWPQLSDGERKRIQIAVSVWREPEVLAIDEPTNHIDAVCRRELMALLSEYNGVGILVSHDRELLDHLCGQCIWLSPAGVHVYSGGYSEAALARAQDLETQQHRRSVLKKQDRKLRKEANLRRARAANEHDKRSKRRLAKQDHDGREKINRARVSDGKAGQPLRQLDGRLAQSRQRIQDASVEKQYDGPIWFRGTGRPNNFLLDVAEQNLALGSGKTLKLPKLTIRALDRVGLGGPNGCGKSSLLRHLSTYWKVPTDKVLYLPQELTLDQAQHALRAAKTMTGAPLGRLMNIVGRLGSRPEQLLRTQAPSPGEIRKLMLAQGLQSEPELIVLDEPTNHLDLPSIVALQAALAQCPCGLLVVSHDETFLQAICTMRWQIESDSDAEWELELMVTPVNN